MATPRLGRRKRATRLNLRKCRVVGFDEQFFARIAIAGTTGWRCTFCGRLFAGAAENRAGFAHDCAIPADAIVET